MTPWMQAVGWTLVHSAWQGVLVAVIAAVAMRVQGSGAPHTRYATACSMLILMLALPIATFAVLSSGSTTVGVDGGVVLSTDDVGLPIVPSGVFAPRLDSASAWRAYVDAVLPVLVLTWLAGVTMLLARAAGGWWRVRRLQLIANRAVPSCWQATADRMAAHMGLHRVVRVVDWPRVDTPMVLGWLKPVVLMPVAALSNLAPGQVEAVIVHELAHIRRHDYVVNLLQTVAETLLFYHPAVWWISRRIRAERELCCDDEVVRVCGDATGYAKALVEIASWQTGRETLAVTATGGELLARVRRLVVHDGRERRNPVVHGMAILGLVAVFVVIAGGVRHVGLIARQLPSEWQTEESDHFSMRFLPELREQAQRVASDADRAYREVATRFRHDIPFRPVLILFATRDQMTRAVASGDFAGATNADERMMIAVGVPPEQLYASLIEEISRVFRTLVPVSQNTPGPLVFEVASIKRNLSGSDFADGGFQPGGRISAVNVTLRNLIIAGYGTNRIEGGPAWGTRDRFDVVATGNRNATVAETRQMLRALLTERFKLVTRIEARESPTFALVEEGRRREGSQLRATSAECAAARAAVESSPPAGPPDPANPRCGGVALGGSPTTGAMLIGRAVTIEQIASSLGNFVDRPVANRSALGGLYDFELTFSRDPSTEIAGAPGILTAIREQLGLRLEPSRGPVDFLIIESAEQPVID